jgi:OPA family glycerol-3-phosphate transporter-like MFS transporter
MLEATFIGYAVFYLVRNNLSPVAADLSQAAAYDKTEIGDFLAASAIAYGIGKFLMGALSDRSNPRYFMPIGLVLTAVCNLAFGASSDYTTHLTLWTINGLAQGMGWPPCGRTLGHWFSENERGTYFAVWNIAHNVGGGIAGVLAAESARLLGWQSAFYVPAALALICAAYLLWRLRDTPQSVGLPSIEEYRNDYPARRPADSATQSHEDELSTYDLIVRNILANPYLWLFASANFFVYITRYAMLDWGPTYLREVKGTDISGGGLSVLILEFAGIPSTLLMGWLSDRMGGRRGRVSLLCMLPIFAAFAGILYTPPGMLWLDLTLLGIIGFFVYPPVMLLGVAGLDFTSKKAVGTAAGFIGLFGYAGRMVQGKVLGTVAETEGWEPALQLVLAATLCAIVLLAFTVRLRPRA